MKVQNWKRIFYTFQAKQEVDGSSNAFLNFIKKRLSEKVREKTGLQDDGSALFNTVFSANNPRLALNSLQTSTERNSFLPKQLDEYFMVPQHII